MTIPVQVALVDRTGELNLERIAGALNEQIQQDFAPVWKVQASAAAFSKAPPNTWAVIVERKLDQPGALGYHTDQNNQPVAYVELTNDVSTTISHEALEMLADPFGNRLHSGRLPAGIEPSFADFGLAHETSRVHYLLEVCDPPEAHSYDVGGIAVSDFLLPHWYRAHPTVSPSYSFAGGCSKPREVAEGGYVSFGAPSGEWYQVFVQNGQAQVQDIGKFNRAEYGSLREWTDANARETRIKV